MAAENGCLAFSAVAFVTHVQMATRQKGVVFYHYYEVFCEEARMSPGPQEVMEHN